MTERTGFVDAEGAPRRPPRPAVLRTLTARLSFGASVLMVSALLAAGLAATGVQRTRVHLDAAVAAEQRINHLSVLSSRIAGYGLLRREAARGGGAATEARLSAQERDILGAFAGLEAAYAAAVTADRADGLDRATATATRALGLAQMRAAFDGLRTRAVDPAPEADEAALAQASGVIGPAVSAMIEDEYRLRSAAFARIDRLHARLTMAAVGIALASVLAASFFLWGVFRPTLRRLEAARTATEAIGRGDFSVSLPDTQDEFAPLYRETRALAAGLEAERRAVDRDRLRLNQIVAERTGALTAANRRLERLDTDRQRFFADVSHELRTPLTVILSEAELARRRPGDAAEALGVIETRARRLMRRIEDLLRLSRSADGRLELEPADCRLLKVAEDVRDEYARRAGALGVEVTAEGDAQVAARVDPDWTRQVLSSLVDNVLRHAASGGTARLSVAAEDAEAVLAVTDAGPGVADADVIFARYARGTATPGSGFGIGLAFARWIVEAQGGTIRARAPGGDAPGLRVEMRFPLVRP